MKKACSEKKTHPKTSWAIKHPHATTEEASVMDAQGAMGSLL